MADPRQQGLVIPDPVPCGFKVKQDEMLVIEVTGTDGKQYELAVARIVVGVAQTPFFHPITKMPIFKVYDQTMDVVTLAKPGSVH